MLSSHLFRLPRSFRSASRFCTGCEESRQYFRAQARPVERVSLAERRRCFQERWATLAAELLTA